MPPITKYVINLLRRFAWTRWPAKQETLVAARVSRNQYQCAKCGLLFPRKLVQIDHVRPVVDPATGFVSLDEYVKRLLVPANKLQVLCKPCHYAKSASENRLR